MHIKGVEGLIRMGSAHQGCGRVNKDRECTSKSVDGLIRMGSAHQGCGRVKKNGESTSRVWKG